MTILKEKKYSDKTRNAIWWGGLCCIGLNLQRLVPGVDFLLPGLLVAMQERRYADLIWAVPLLVILQEGAGTLEFGLNLLRYMTAALLFFLGRWLFDVERLLYMLLFSACLAASCFAVAFLVSPLYAVPVEVSKLLDESLYQALTLPPAWKTAQMTRVWVYANDRADEN